MEEELFSYEKPELVLPESGIVRGESCLNGIVNEDAGAIPILRRSFSE